MSWNWIKGRTAIADQPVRWLPLLLFVGGLYGYTATLAPTVLEGDAALFQYTPYVLGVTYPTGFPLYILLTKVWLSLLPYGEIAWRMNLFSALCGAAALPLIYRAARRLFGLASEAGQPALNLAALTATLTFATIPTFWRWATEAKTYTLTILLFGGLLYLLSRAISPAEDSPAFVAWWPLLLGLMISVHNTGVLLIPGLLLLGWLHFRGRPWRFHLRALALLMLPGLFYLYIPLRAEWLIAQYGRQAAIEHGLLADFYQSGPAGLIRYYTATSFTGGVVTNWGLVPGKFFSLYVADLLVDNLTVWGAGLGLVGGLALAWRRPRLFWPLFLLYATPIPFVLAYNQGEQSAFLLPSFLIFSLFVGYTVTLLPRPAVTGPLFFLAVSLLLFAPRVRYNMNWLDNKWDRTIYEQWADALAHPLEPGAVMLAHWGDLTSFWYMQHAEGRRPDLRGVYPPTEQAVADYVGRGEALYIGGPLQGAAAHIEDRYHLITWGRLVRIAPRRVEPETLLPPLSQPVETTFAGKLRLIGVDFAPKAAGGQTYAVTLSWQALADLPPETTISLRLSQGQAIVAQTDETLLSGWLPRDTLSGGQPALSYVRIPIALGTVPGQYRLQLVAYTSYKQPWSLPDGTTRLDLGAVEITAPPVAYRPESKLAGGYDFNGEIELVDYNYTVSRVGQGKGFGVELLWRAKKQPVDNYTLVAEIVDQADNVLRAFEHPPVGGRAPTAGWQTGQFVRDQVDVVVPASAPAGEKPVRVRLSWQRPDGSRLRLRRWLFPAGESLYLAPMEVEEKEGRIFEAPPVQVEIGANLADKARLIGYNSPRLGEAGAVIRCPAGEAIHFDFYWEGLSEMETIYFVFLHLVDETGQIVAQHDRGPGRRAKQPTTAWLPGEIIHDPVDLALPPDLAPGLYTLRIGLYQHPAGPRLTPVAGDGRDFVEIGRVRVE